MFRAPTAGDQSLALGYALGDVSLDTLALPCTGQRAHLAVRGVWVSDLDRGEPGGNRIDEFVVTLLADDDACQRGADLAGKEKNLVAHDLRRRGAQIHVVEDDCRRFAAEFQGAPRHPLRTDACDALTGRRRSGEGDFCRRAGRGRGVRRPIVQQ